MVRTDPTDDWLYNVRKQLGIAQGPNGIISGKMIPYSVKNNEVTFRPGSPNEQTFLYPNTGLGKPNSAGQRTNNVPDFGKEYDEMRDNEYRKAKAEKRSPRLDAVGNARMYYIQKRMREYLGPNSR